MGYRKAWHRIAGQGLFGRGMGLITSDSSFRGRARFVVAGPGNAWLGLVWFSLAWLVEAGSGEAWTYY